LHFPQFCILLSYDYLWRSASLLFYRTPVCPIEKEQKLYEGVMRRVSWQRSRQMTIARQNHTCCLRSERTKSPPIVDGLLRRV
jgi:hypothetical protein